MSSSDSEKQLAAFLEESYQFWDKLFHIAIASLGDAAEAEDAVQDILIKAASRQDQFEGRSQLYTWLVRILINHCHDLHRKRKRRKTQSFSRKDRSGEDYQVEVEDHRQNLQKKVELSEMSGRLIEVTGQLDDIYKEVVVLRYFEEMSYQEIADTLQISEGTVKSRLNNARRLLKDRLVAAGIGEEYLGL